MLSQLLVPMDGSEMSERALEYALENHPDAHITVLHVAGGPSPMFGSSVGLSLEDDVESAAKEQATEIFDHAKEVAAEYGREIATTIKLGHPARTIVNHAKNFDTVFIGTHSGSLVDRLFVGNVAQQVVQGSPVPVVVVR